MFEYTFFGKGKGTSLEDAINFIKTTDKPIKYTHGLTFRNPTTYKVPKTREEALEIINKNSWVDVDEYEDYVHVNTYSDNDMW